MLAHRGKARAAKKAASFQNMVLLKVTLPVQRTEAQLEAEDLESTPGPVNRFSG